MNENNCFVCDKDLLMGVVKQQIYSHCIYNITFTDKNKVTFIKILKKRFHTVGGNKIHAYIFIKYLTIWSRVDKNYILNSQILIKE